MPKLSRTRSRSPAGPTRPDSLPASLAKAPDVAPPSRRAQRLEIRSGDPLERYGLALAGNGVVSLLVDPRGQQGTSGSNGVLPGIWWAGKRYDRPRYPLIPFGLFRLEVRAPRRGRPPRRAGAAGWMQRIAPQDGQVLCRVRGTEGEGYALRVFAPAGEASIVLGVRPETPRATVLLHYHLASPEHPASLPDGFTVSSRRYPTSSGLRIEFRVRGVDDARGSIHLLASGRVRTMTRGNESTLIRRLVDGDQEVYFTIAFKDGSTVSRPVPCGPPDERAHRRDWRAFQREGYIDTPRADLNRQWALSLYHLRSQLTTWSMPQGILPSHGEGRYDHLEIFAFTALCAANHLDLARRIPDFRSATLHQAVRRSWWTGARFPRQSTEQGQEGAPPGAWCDAIHPMAAFAREAWLYHEWSGDVGWLREAGFPLLRAVAEWYARWAVVSRGRERAEIAPCCDLDESVFPVRNGLYTAAGAAGTFRSCVQAARRLGTFLPQEETYTHLAAALERTLPVERRRFVPFLGATQTHIAVLGPLFPLGLVGPRDPRLIAALDDFMARCVFPGWVAVGSSGRYAPQGWVWAAGWLASCLAMLHRGEDALAILDRAMQCLGSLGCPSEHVDGDRFVLPWFTAASATFVHAMASMWLQSDTAAIQILPAVPAGWTCGRFRLLAPGPVVVEAEAERGRIRCVHLEARGAPPRGDAHVRRIVIPRRWAQGEPAVEGGQLRRTGAGRYRIRFPRSIRLTWNAGSS